MWTVAFWKATAERVISTVVQTLIPTVAATRLDLIDWVTTSWIVAGAGVLSLLKAIVAANVGNSGPSLTSVEKLVADAPGD